MASQKHRSWLGGLTTLLFAGYCWSVTPVEDPREQLPAPSLVQECGLSSDHVFRGRLIRLHSGPGFSGFIRELDGLTYASYFGTQEALRTAKIIPMANASGWQTDEHEGRHGFHLVWKMVEPSRKKIILLERGTYCDLVVLLDLRDQVDWERGLLSFLEAIAPAERHKSSK